MITACVCFACCAVLRDVALLQGIQIKEGPLSSVCVCVCVWY